jgi:hypothetical protein
LVAVTVDQGKSPLPPFKKGGFDTRRVQIPLSQNASVSVGWALPTILSVGRAHPTFCTGGTPVLLNPRFYFFEKDFSFMLLI